MENEIAELERQLREVTQPAQPAPRPVADQLRLALSVLSLRVVRWVTLLLSFSLFAVAVWKPDLWRIVAATAFTVLVNLPIWLKRGA